MSSHAQPVRAARRSGRAVQAQRCGPGGGDLACRGITSAGSGVETIVPRRTAGPRGFPEKVRYEMLRDHRELPVTFADKATVRDPVAGLVGEHHLPRAVWRRPVPAITRQGGTAAATAWSAAHRSCAGVEHCGPR